MTTTKFFLDNEQHLFGMKTPLTSEGDRVVQDEADPGEVEGTGARGEYLSEFPDIPPRKSLSFLAGSGRVSQFSNPCILL